jgi:hypothetical protein
MVAGIGSLFCLFYTLTLLYPLLRFMPAPKVSNREIPFASLFAPNGLYSRSLSSKKARRLVVAVSSILLISAISLLPLLKVNSNPFTYFSDDVPLKQANDMVIKHFKAADGPQFVVSVDDAGAIKNPELLTKVDALIDWIKKDSDVAGVFSILDIVKETNFLLRGKKELPASREAVAETLLLYSLGLPQGQDISQWITLNEDALRIAVTWHVQDSSVFLEKVAAIEQRAKEQGLFLQAAGKLPLYMEMNGYVVKTFVESMALALLTVSLCIGIFFRSALLGLLSLIPNIIPLLWGAGVMAIFGIELNIGTVLLVSVCLGIAVDDTIHILSHFRNYRKQGLLKEEALKKVIAQSGPALTLTTCTLVCGFGLFVLGDFVPNVYFGVLCAIILGLALLVDLLLLPVFLTYESRK